MGKLALKRLTQSDLTLFEWHFRNRNAGNQKAINLNADVFVGALFPALATLGTERLPLDLYLYGPAGKPELNLQRKILKGSTYKNWRLNGEMIHNPEADPARFDVLADGDIAVLEFNDGIAPSQGRCVFLAAAAAEDAALHAALTNALEHRSMVSLDQGTLQGVVQQAGVSSEHPIQALLLDADLEDAVQGDVEAIRQLGRRRAARPIRRSDLQEAKRRAEESGQRGEELINEFLQDRVSKGGIDRFEWSSSENAVTPFDFVVHDGGNVPQQVEVKSTTGKFERPMHVSIAELQEMSERERFALYRVYNLTEAGAELRVTSAVRLIAQQILDSLRHLPSGVMADTMAISPDVLDFGEPMSLRFGE